MIVSARYLVPVRPKGAVLEAHAIRIENGLIREILPAAKARRELGDEPWVELPTHVLVPGLINMHTHSPMALFRGYADDMDLHDWLSGHIWPLERRWVSHEFVFDGTELALAEMIRGGTTTFNDNYFFPDAMAEITHQSGIRAAIGLPFVDAPTAWASDPDEYFDKNLDVAERWRGDPKITFTLAPHAPYTCSDETFGRIARLSHDKGMLVHLHLMETPWDKEHSMEHYKSTPLTRLSNFGLLNDRLIAVHMTNLTSEEIDFVAKRHIHVAHCPQSNLKLASGFCPVAELLDAGVNVSIGTDSAASNNDLDLINEAQTAALLCKGVSGDPKSGSAPDVLDMLTINAATALGMGDLIGTIEPGKKADLCALDLSYPETQPVHNVISQLVYAVSRRQVSDVWVAGQRLLEDGVLTTIDLERVMDKAAHWKAAIHSGMGSSGELRK